MPQMSPLMWGILFMSFSALMVLMFVKTYFAYFNQTKPLTSTHVNSKAPMDWTW